MGGGANVTEMETKEIVMERVFDAPRERVFEVFTKPEHIQKWWGPKKAGIAVVEFDARVGGEIFVGERGVDGAMHYFAGVVREIVPPSRVVVAFHVVDENRRRVGLRAAAIPDEWQGEIVQEVTLAADGSRTHGALTTVTLDERAGKTYVTLTSVYQSREDRDAVIASGMEWGARLSYLQLDEVLEDLAA